MISQKQFQDEARQEAEFEKLSAAVIKYLPFGKWYGYMVGASNLLKKKLKKQIGVSPDGRPIVVYKGFGKTLSTFATASHTSIFKSFAHKDWKNGFKGILTGGLSSNLQNIKAQKKAKLFNLTPDQVTKLWAKKMAAKNPANKALIIKAVKKDIVKQDLKKIEKHLELEKSKKLKLALLLKEGFHRSGIK